MKSKKQLKGKLNEIGSAIEKYSSKIEKRKNEIRMKYIKIHRFEFKDMGNGWPIGLIILCFCLFPFLLLHYPLDESLNSWFLIFIGFCIGTFFSLIEIKTYKVKVEEV